MPDWKVPGYTELKELGSGGFGEVVLARHDSSGTLVAIKYLRQDLLADQEFAEMFRSEATVLASLDDPNVVRLYEYVESPSGAAIVMELIGGVPLREILTFQGKTTAEASLVVLQGSLLGLAAAHRRGVVHRDYKPENVLVNGDGVSKLTDFGIAARAGDRPVPAGTLLYAAPEQIAGAVASPASDVYAATATFYECLTGRPPFHGETADLIRQHRFEPVPLEPVPEPLQPLVTAGMAKDPAHRPADAATFVTRLKAAASGAYGRDWQDRGRLHLGEAALLLAALWPSGPPPAAQGTTVHQVPLRRHAKPRHFRTSRTAITVGAGIAVAAAGTFIVATRSSSYRPSTAVHPLTVQSISLQPKQRSTAPATSRSQSALSPSPSASRKRSAAPGYDQYANPRYGFTVLRPSTFRAQPPPEDGDGQGWTSPDGQVLFSAYGANNAFNYSPGQDEAADAHGVSVVYSNIKGNVVTVSGYKDSGRTIVYQRDVVGPGAIDTLYWSYPANQKALWNAAVTLTAQTFQPGDVTTAHLHHLT